MSDAKKVLKMIADNDVKYVDFRFTDLRGRWHHVTHSAGHTDKDLLDKGLFIDGSSINGWKDINESDMTLQPDLETAVLDPFAAETQLIIYCDVVEPSTGNIYNRDPRGIAKRAEEYMRSEKLADDAFFGPEPEFFVFDDVRYKSGYNESYYFLDSEEGPYNSGREYPNNNNGYKMGPKGGYFPVAPLDSIADMRAEMVTLLSEMGVEVEKHHHEVAPSQHELGFKFGSLVKSADNLQKYKYVVQNVANAYGKSATFMPKPIFGDNGSGMHVHQSLWKDGKPLFLGKEYAGLSKTALYYIGGILKHAKALNAFTNPSTNSYKRLLPGYEAPVMLAYSARNRSAACRIPVVSSEKARRFEARFPDPMANGYLAFAALLMAGLDGIRNKIEPGEPQDRNLYELEKEELDAIPQVCGSLTEALAALKADHEFLTAGNVFDKDMIDAYIELKEEEARELQFAPHPVEFKMYYTS